MSTAAPDTLRLARDGLHVLQQRMLRAVVEAQSPADLLAIQRDLVTGAQRLEAALATALAEVRAFRHDAEDALARYERRPALQTPRLQLERKHGDEGWQALEGDAG